MRTRIALFVVAAAALAAAQPLRVRLVTGGHDHEPSIYSVFDRMPGVDTQVRPHPDAFTGKLDASTDVLVLYDMVQSLPDAQRHALEAFARTRGKGIVVLHHALVDHQSWPVWYRDIAAGRYILKAEDQLPASTFRHDVAMHVRPLAKHPVIEGIEPFHILDETYKGMWISPQVTPLLRTDEPSSDGPVAWISPWPHARVVVIQLGHGRTAHEHPSFRRLVRNAVFWTADRDASLRTPSKAAPAEKLSSGPGPLPTIRTFLPDPAIATGAAVLVCPGGGYRNVAVEHEGYPTAAFLNSIGVAAFVLEYRRGPEHGHPTPLDDAVAGMRWIRARAAQFRIDAKRLGVWGFSAGGHLASTLSLHAPADARPAFQILTYPVISMQDPIAHLGSRRNLLGERPDPALARKLSGELNVTAATPPAFLFHGHDDTGVDVANSVGYYLALRRANVPAELHVYNHAPHGVGIAAMDPIAGTYTARIADWLQLRGFLRPGNAPK